MKIILYMKTFRLKEKGILSSHDGNAEKTPIKTQIYIFIENFANGCVCLPSPMAPQLSFSITYVSSKW